MEKTFLVEVSARHVHVSQEDLEVLFGEGATLTPMRDLSQPGQYLAEERVDVIGPKRTLSNVAILGPTRSKTQVEMSVTDSYGIGQAAPVRESGDVVNTPGLRIKGPKGEIEIKEGLIAAKRHIHMTTDRKSVV